MTASHGQFTGELATDITVKRINGKSRARVGLRVTESELDANGREIGRPFTIPVILHGRRAEQCAASVHAGDRITVSGKFLPHLYSDEWHHDRIELQLHADVFALDVIDVAVRVEKIDPRGSFVKQVERPAVAVFDPDTEASVA